MQHMFNHIIRNTVGAIDINGSMKEDFVKSIPAHRVLPESQPAGELSLCWPILPESPGSAGELAVGTLSRWSAAALCLDS